MNRGELIQLANEIRKSRIQKDEWPLWYPEYKNLVSIEHKTLAVEEYPDLEYYLIYPEGTARQSYPLLIDYHGGGFIYGLEERNLLLGASLAVRAGCAVIEVDYAVAPEHPFPTAWRQSIALLQHVLEGKEADNLDLNKIVLCGHSAGANIAAASMLYLHAENIDCIRGQILDYPPLDLFTDPKDKPDVPESPIPYDRARIFNEMYLENPEEKDNPYVSPVLASPEMLSGLPETVIITSGKDVLKFEADQYTQNLIEAGVQVTAKRFTQSRHGMTEYCSGEWEETHKLIVDTIRRWIQ